MTRITDDKFYDKIDINYMLKGDADGKVYTSDVMRFFGVDIEKANESKPKVQQIADRLKK